MCKCTRRQGVTMAAVAISHTVRHVQVVVLDDEVRIIVTVALGHTVAVAVLAGIL